MIGRCALLCVVAVAAYALGASHGVVVGADVERKRQSQPYRVRWGT